MKIIIKESLDDFDDDYLDYDEDKYYLVDSFKDFKKYAHKGKHHQDIEAITSNFKKLLKDLEKNNIYIDNEFKDMEDSDLSIDYNYRILPINMVDNIINQLGYKPNIMRTYKDDIIKYKGENISSAEFENIINNRNSEYHWINKCYFKDMEVIIYNDTYKYKPSGILLRGGKINRSTITKAILENTQTTYSNILDCKQRSNKFIKCSFKNCGSVSGDKFNYCSWNIDNNPILEYAGECYESECFNMDWYGGVLEKSEWSGGEWHDGEFKDSKWYSGIFNKGRFNNSHWSGGVFNGGLFIKSSWFNGEFNNGTFENSSWSDYNQNSEWNNGIWVLKSKKNNEFSGREIDSKYISFEYKKKLYSLDEILSNKSNILMALKDMLIKSNEKNLQLGSYKLTLYDIEHRLGKI